MALLKRDIDSITGLRTLLDQLEQQLSTLGDGQLTADEREKLTELLEQLNGDLTYLLTNLHLSDAVYETGDDEKVATVKAIREYVLAALQATGPQLTLEHLQVNNGVVYLSHLPINGKEGILNFGRCLYQDEQGNELPLSLTPGETEYAFTVESGMTDLSAKMVMVQYFHYYDPRELNTLIGNLILDGLVLVEPTAPSGE